VSPGLVGRGPEARVGLTLRDNFDIFYILARNNT